MREGIGGYVPGSVVWVPWSIARPEQRAVRSHKSWLGRLLATRRASLYQRCLALHIMSASDTEPLS